MAKVALLIGVSEYQPEFNPLPSAVKDIEALQRVLQNPDMGGFDDVKILPNPEPFVMQEAIELLFSESARDDLALLFFSGHGIRDASGKFFFATSRTRKNQKGELLKATAVPATVIHDHLSSSRCKRKVVLLDCCFSGAFAEGMSAKDDGSVDVKSQLGGEGWVVLTSSTSTQYSFEQKDSDLSIYTRFLVEGLETGDADLDRDGRVAVDELHEYAQRKVREAEPGMKPEIYSGKEGYKIFLASVPPTDPMSRYSREIAQLAYMREITFPAQTWLTQIQNWLSIPTEEIYHLSPARRKILEAYRQQLGLSPGVAHHIEIETLKPYREFYQKLDSYKQELIREFRRERPLSEPTRRTLKKLQHSLGISDDYAISVEREVARRFEQFASLPKQVIGNFTNPKILHPLANGILFLALLIFGWMIWEFFRNQSEPSLQPSAEYSPAVPPIESPLPTPTISPNSFDQTAAPLNQFPYPNPSPLLPTPNPSQINPARAGNQPQTP